MLLNKKRILVVDDNAQNRLLFGMLLRKHGASISFEPWGHSTVDQIRLLGRVHVVILDLMLTGELTGYTVFEEIAAMYPHIPVVAVSATDPAIAIPKVRAQGFAGFISKPIDFDLFPQQIAQIIETGSLWPLG